MKIKHLKELLANVDDDGDFMIVITKPIPENERSTIYPYPSEHTTHRVDEDAWEKTYGPATFRIHLNVN